MKKRKRGGLSGCTATAVAQSTDVTTGASLSAIAIGENEEEVLSAILVRSPLKSLVRFKSVSKCWLSLISSLLRNNSYPRLSGLLRRKKWQSSIVHPTGPYFEFVSPKSSSSSPPLKSPNFVNRIANFSGMDILQSCNGLLLCSTSLLGTDRSYFVVNPTTKQYKVFYTPRGFDGLHIAFDPSKSHHYKLVGVRSIGESLYDSDDLHGRYQIEIYSSESRRWSISSENIFMGRRCDSFTEGVFWNRSIHWRGAWKRFNVDLGGIEEMPALPGPPRDSGTWKCVSFGESNGHLHLIEEPFPTKLRVFEMESDYSGWFVKYNIDLDGLVAEFPAIVHRSPKPFAPDWYAFSVLGVVREENEDESLLLLSLLDEVVSCSFKDGTLTELLELVPEEIDERCVLRSRECPCRPLFTKDDVFLYIESVALV